MSFQYRSYQKELLDGIGIPFEDIKQNMQELNVINHYLGGHRITLSAVKKLIGESREVISIAEIGCGGGDNLRQIAAWCKKENIKIELIGIDINKECIAFAKSQPSNVDIQFVCSDYKTINFDHKPDIIFSSLFCHHFTEDELIFMMQWMRMNCSKGFFINDLHRHPLAYYSIMFLTRLFSRSYLVKNDAPLSVKRGFVKKEWDDIFFKAGIPRVNIEWKWAFRWLITFTH